MKTIASKKLRTGIALTAAGFAITPNAVHALGIRVQDQDPFAIARGNAFVATANNPSAVYYNPAGISQLSGHHFSLGANAISISSEFTSPTGASASTADKWHALPQLYYTYNPESLPLTFGIGTYSPFGLGTEWPDQSPFRVVAIEGEMRYGTLNPVVSWAINEKISVAAGVMANYADTTLSRGLTPPGVMNGSKLEFTGNGWSVGFNLGVLWEITEQHSVGATYRSSSEMKFTGDAFSSLPVPSTQGASAKFQFPHNIAVGYSFRPTENWNFEVNVDWTDWGTLNNVVLETSSGNQVIPFNWQSSWIVNLGGTRYFGDGWSVSAGYIFSQNSVPEESFNPSIPDSDRHVFSVGAGKQWERLGVDASFQYGYGPSRTIANPATAPNATANGAYEFNSISLVIAGRYSF